jgi:hypothetical protein
MYVLVMLSEIWNADACLPNCMVEHPRWCNINICDCGTLILFQSGLVLQDIHHRIFIFAVSPCDISKVYISHGFGLLLKFSDSFMFTVCCILIVWYGPRLPIVIVWV